MSSTKILKLSSNEIGRGAYGLVFRALDTTSGTSLAVKKSRVSLRIRRTLLHYEAEVLQALRGHPAIPTLFGYGRFSHFEYLGMELGGKSVMDIVKHNDSHGVQLKTVILLALQIISALQHIHSRGFIHRDVKPDHMLLSLSDSARIMFVDYGIACPRPQVSSTKRYDPELQRKQVVGTLKWASLNAHNGLHLSWRDDLISLSYVLLFLLRGNLPWVSTPKGSTAVGAAVRLRLAKEKWTGSQLAQGYPVEFGCFLDQTKDLGFDETPPYERYMELFEDLYRRSGFSNTDKSFDWTPVTTSPSGFLGELSVYLSDITCPLLTSNSKADRESKERCQCNHHLVPGQIVVAQLMPEVSILGVMPDDDLWSMIERKASPSRRPAVVLKVFTSEDGLQHVTLAVLARENDPPSGQSVPFGPGQLETVPSWPFNDTYCYVFPRPMSFVIGMAQVCQPSLSRVPTELNSSFVTLQGDSEYRVREEHISLLLRELGEVTPNEQMLDASDRQVLEYMEGRDDEPVVVSIEPLTLSTDGLDWTGTRGWFDEIKFIHTTRAKDKGYPWAYSASDDSDSEGYLSDSYIPMDGIEWDDRQEERSETLTLRTLPPSLLLGGEEPIPPITKVIESELN
ncbi:hypothetical protein PAXRUDRAFT_10721 [Paxillus rubicundulus Ve08.2h10]|uniref:Protein kinase domain-containing protein n=1 Tax=Paxillus rubicundulus Ve08.2h10 TaxID=930991 RepID=A0A0D0DFP4_9AGAM|nr:hypothetical protein PAXRUDRAFT_10721 [Paxillus rubicundulus Ve08.2h10]